jgi:hypothetical protein
MESQEEKIIEEARKLKLRNKNNVNNFWSLRNKISVSKLRKQYNDIISSISKTPEMISVFINNLSPVTKTRNIEKN